MAVKTHRLIMDKRGKSIDIGSAESIKRIRDLRARARQTKKPMSAKQLLTLKRSIARAKKTA